MTQANEVIEEVEKAYGKYEIGKLYVTRNLCWRNYVARDVFLIYLGPGPSQNTVDLKVLAPSYKFLIILPDSPKTVLVYQYRVDIILKTCCLDLNEIGKVLCYLTPIPIKGI